MIVLRYIRKNPLYIFALIFILLPINAFTEETYKQQICKCIRGLNAFSVDIKKYRPDLNHKYPRNLGGYVLMNAKNFTDTEEKSLIDSVGSKDEVIYCYFSEALDNYSIDILLKAYHGYLSDNPFDDLALCWAAFLIKAPGFDKKYGEKKGYHMGSLIGKQAGRVLASLNYLYKGQNFTFEDITSAAVKHLQSMAPKEEEEKKRLLGSYCKICEWYDIPLKSLLTGADIVGK